MKLLSRVQLFATPWTVAYHAPPSMGFSRQEYWSGLPFPSPEDLPDPGIEPGSPTFQADALTSEPPGKPLIHYLGLLIAFLSIMERLQDNMEKEMAAHSSTIAWKIPWTEEPGRLQSMGW